MNIAYIVLKGMPVGGGIEKYTEEIGTRLAARGHRIIVYTMKHYGTTEGLYKGMILRTVPAVRKKSMEKLMASFTSMMEQCVRGDADIYHFHAYGPAMLSFIPKMLGAKIILQGHGIEWQRSRWGPLGRLFLRMTEWPSVILPHMLTVVSRVQQEYLRKKYDRDSVYIPTGINPPRLEKPDLINQLGLRGNDFILFAARLVREKGAHYLIEAYKKLKTDLKLVIAGDVEHEEEYKAGLYKLAEGNPNIIFTGFVRGQLLAELFSNCYLFVLPSELEGLSIALLEAMSYGNCCLVSDIPENLEALNGHGYSFRSKSAADLADKMEYLIGNPGDVEAVKEPAKNYVLENHSWDNIALQFESVYRELLSLDRNGGFHN
jgi:glycosyltransferase involved in cell wall biosynthesis